MSGKIKQEDGVMRYPPLCFCHKGRAVSPSGFDDIEGDNTGEGGLIQIL